MRWVGFICLTICVAGDAAGQVRTVPGERPGAAQPGGVNTTAPGGAQPGTSYQGGTPDLRGTLGGVPGAPQVLNPDGSVMQAPAAEAPASAADVAEESDMNLQVVPPSDVAEPEDGDGEAEEPAEDDSWWQGWLALILIAGVILFLGREKR